MMNQREKNEMRKTVGEKISEVLEVEGFSFAGFTTEGAAFENEETGDTFVVRTIMKTEKFDLEDAMAEFEEKEEKARERVKEKAEKKAKREKKKEEEGE